MQNQIKKVIFDILLKLFNYPLTDNGSLAMTLDILCHMKIFKFLRIFELLHVVSEHKVQTLGLNVAQLA